MVKPYAFDDIVRALNAVAPNDWATFLNTRLQSTTSAPLGGIEASGWKLVYDDKPNMAEEEQAKRHKETSAATTLGFDVAEAGRIGDVLPGTPAAKGGLVPGARVIAINGRHFTPAVLKDAIRESKNNTAPIQVIYESEDFVNVTTLDYRGGLRYPHLVRIDGSRDRLSELGRSLVRK